LREGITSNMTLNCIFIAPTTLAAIFTKWGVRIPDLRNLKEMLQERIDKANPRLTLTAEEGKRLAKLEAIVDRLRRG
jgi:hypothetical protein